MKEEASMISQIHDTNRRTKYIAHKQLQDDVKKAQESCHAQNMDLGGPDCAALMKQERRQKFVQMFKEIQAWNTINQFVAGM